MSRNTNEHSYSTSPVYGSLRNTVSNHYHAWSRDIASSWSRSISLLCL